jgi:hypothetical protein
MKTPSLVALPLLVALSLGAGLAACGADEESPAAPVAAGGSGPDDQGGGDTSDASDTNAEDGSGTDADTTEPDDTTADDVDSPDSGSGDDADTDSGEDATDGSVEGPECTVDDECPPRSVCVDGACVRVCTTDAQCDDLNPCSLDRCVEGFCVAEPITPLIPDELEGDCVAEACVEGVLQEVTDVTDTPADDAIACTVERCQGRFPARTNEHSFCDDGDDLNGFELCVPSEGGCTTGDAPPWVCADFDPGYERDEVCGDGQDNDGDGLADEDCTCEFGSTQRCFVGPPNAREVGGCLDGVQQCINRDAPRWSECRGGLLPQAEICDTKDNDCNGCVDDLEDCAPLYACPDEDFARPLRFYPLDGTALFDREPDSAEWTWTVIAPPNSATRSVEEPTNPVTRLYLDVSGDYQVSLSVRDEKGDLYGCSWVVHVAGSGLRVEMRWNTFGRVDMDFHLHRSGSTRGFCTDDDCYYANCISSTRAWGYDPSPGTECGRTGGTCNNPRLDIDNISGFDPENINLDNPNDGDSFRVMAHMFSGSATTDPVVSIYCGGTLQAVLGEAPDGVGLNRSGGGCQGQTWRVADVQMSVNPSTGATTCAVDVLENASGDWDVRTNSAAY